MKLRTLTLFFTLSFLLALSFAPAALGQSPSTSEHIADAPNELHEGAVVEKIDHNSEAEKAGLREGDIFLHWFRGESSGAIESPFDLSWVEAEQKPRGQITIEGFRGTEKLAWALGPTKWGIQSRPYLDRDILSIYQQGQSFAKIGKARETLTLWQNAVAKAKESKLQSAWLLFNVGGSLTDSRQWTEADEAYQAAIQQAEHVGSVVAIQILRAWAQTFYLHSDWANAEKKYQLAMIESQKLSSENLSVAICLNNLGGIAHRRGDLLKAGEYYQQSLVIREKLAPDSLDVAASLNNMGLLSSDRGDLADAEEYLNQSLSIKEKLAFGSVEVTASLNNLGRIAHRHGDLDKAEVYYRKSLAIREKLSPGSIDVAASLNNLGAIASDRGDLDKAEAYYRESLVIKEKLEPTSLDVSGGLNNLGNIAHRRGDLAKAEVYHRQALAIREKLAPSSLDVAVSLVNLGIDIWDRGHFDEAAAYYRQALAIQKRLAPGSVEVATSLNRLAEVSYQQGDLGKAEEYCQQALAIQEKLAPNSLDAATSFNHLGEIAHQRDDLIKEEEYERQALVIREKLAPGSMEHAGTLAALAGIILKKQQVEEAAQLFGKALDVLESQIAHLGGGTEVRSGFRAQHADYYSNYISLLIQQDKPELAFQVLERSRAQTLREMLTEAHIDIRKGVDATLLKREKSLRATTNAKSNRRSELLTGKHTEEQIKAVDKEMEDFRRQYEDIEGQIRISSPAYAALTQPRPLSAKEI